MFKYTQSTILHDIHVIGCGGTGSRLVPQLTQFISTMIAGRTMQGYLTTPKIYLWDFDQVETKNLLRQNFAPSDVGKDKASILAQRYGKTYDVELIPVRVRVEADLRKTLQNIKAVEGWDLMTHSNQIMLIMCVDTAQARRDILNFFAQIIPDQMSSGLSSFVIDAGNEDNFGQVKFFNFVNGIANPRELPPTAIDFYKMEEASFALPIIPMDFDYYTNLKEGEVRTSCADLDQTLAINSQMASMIMGVVQNYYFGKPMTFNQVSYSLSGSTSVTDLTLREIDRVCTNNYKNSGQMLFPTSLNLTRQLAEYMDKSYALTNIIRKAEAAEKVKQDEKFQKLVETSVAAKLKIAEAQMRETLIKELGTNKGVEQTTFLKETATVPVVEAQPVEKLEEPVAATPKKAIKRAKSIDEVNKELVKLMPSEAWPFNTGDK
jgi:hypothetical protein